MKKIVLLLCLVLSGCATNPYKQYFTDLTGGIDVSKDSAFIISTEDPKIYQGGTNVEQDYQRMVEEGYGLLGYSSFNSGALNQKSAIQHGKAIHASIILVYSKYTHTNSGVLPLTLPDNQTTQTSMSGTGYGSGNIYGSRGSASYNSSGFYSGTATTTTYGTKTTYIPYNTQRYDYIASYWIKSKPRVLGVQLADLTPEERKALGSNKGTKIMAVVKGSPAFTADLFKGDILTQINDKEIIESKSLTDLLNEFKGKKVIFKVFRDNQFLTKEVQLNSPSE
jgi:hypothetical protein